MRYLSNYVAGLKHNEALTDGLPIVTDVIEGRCRYPVNDCIERTGSRWSIEAPETTPKIRALWASGDWSEQVGFHREREAQRAATSGRMINNHAAFKHATCRMGVDASDVEEGNGIQTLRTCAGLSTAPA